MKWLLLFLFACAVDQAQAWPFHRATASPCAGGQPVRRRPVRCAQDSGGARPDEGEARPNPQGGRAAAEARSDQEGPGPDKGQAGSGAETHGCHSRSAGEIPAASVRTVAVRANHAKYLAGGRRWKNLPMCCLQRSPLRSQPPLRSEARGRDRACEAIREMGSWQAATQIVCRPPSNRDRQDTGPEALDVHTQHDPGTRINHERTQ